MILKKHKILRAFIAATLVVALAGLFLPWKHALDFGLRHYLEARGVTSAQLTVTQADFSRIALRDVSLGGKPLLGEIAIEALQGNLLTASERRLTIIGLDLDIRKDGDIWRINGFALGEEKPDEPFALPISPEKLVGLILTGAEIKNSHARIATENWELDVPLEVTMQTRPAPKIVLNASGIAFKTQGMYVTTGAGSASAQLANKSSWDGSWTLHDIQFSEAVATLPVLTGKGTLSLYADKVTAQGDFQDADKTAHVSFGINGVFADPGSSALTISHAAVPWLGGSLLVSDAKVPFKIGGAVNMKFGIKSVSAQKLMQELTGERATATGSLSGTVPVTFLPDGNIVFHEGLLQAGQPGTITLSPEAIPGDNPQVSFVRNVLQDFHYTALSLRLNTGNDRSLEMQMTLEGNNPKVQKGRAVKVNVNLKGDVLDFVKQNLIWLTAPQQMMEQSKNVQP